MSPRSFLHVTTFYPPYHFGGDAIYVQRLTEALAERGQHVEVVHNSDAFNLLSRGSVGPTPQTSVAAVHGLRSPAGFLAPLAAHQTGHPLLNRRALRRILASRRFDVIHYHNISLFGPGVLTMGTAPGTAKLYTAHEHWLVCPSHILWKLGQRACERPECLRCVLASRRPPQLWRYTSLLERCAAHVNRFIAPSRAAADMHRQRGFSRPFEVLPIFAPRANGAGPRPHPSPYFLFAGRLEPFKGLHTVLPLFEDVDADLLVAGHGSAAAALRMQAAGNPRVHFLGHVSQAELGPLYEHAVACLVPSQTYEVFPTVILEAFGRRTPVIAHDIGATAEVVRDSGGGLIYGYPTELRASMQRFLTEPALRAELGERGHQTFLQRWTIEAHLDKYLALVEEVHQARRERNPTP